MKLLIDIPEQAYNVLKDQGVDWLGAEHILNAVSNGKPYEENPTGHWTEYHTKTDLGYGKIYYQHEKCSCNLYESPYKFCPNCGVVMEKKNEADN